MFYMLHIICLISNIFFKIVFSAHTETNRMTVIFATFMMTTLDFTMIKLELKVPDISSKT